MSELQVFTCGKPRDHECDMDGGNIVGDSEGNVWPEEQARKDPSVRFKFSEHSVEPELEALEEK